MSTFRARPKFAAALVASLIGLALAAPADARDARDAGDVGDTRDVWDGFTPPKPTYPKFDVETDVPVTMRDGTILSADVYRPARADGSPVPGRFPVVVVQTVYGKGTMGPMPNGLPGPSGTWLAFARYGYVHVVVDVRGTGGSQGAFDPLGAESNRDNYDTVQWAAGQPWSSGRVGALGFSFMGVSAVHTAAAHPPALKALVDGGTPVDIYRDFVAQGGNVASSSGLWLVLELMGAVPSVAVNNPTASPVPGAAALLGRLANDADGFPFRAKAAVGLATGEINWADDPFWVERSVDARDIRVPTLVYAGWEDLFVRAPGRQYREMRLRPGSEKQLLLGPWTHYSVNRPIGPGGSGDPDLLAVAWFDRHLKGIRNGIERLGPVTLYDQGADRWSRYRSWPPGPDGFERLYLTGEKSGSALSLNDGSLSSRPPASAGKDQGQANLISGICSRQLSQFSVVPDAVPCNVEQRQLELLSYTYTTAPFESPTRLTGPATATLRASSTAPDPTYVALLSDVAPDGRSHPITGGGLVASRRVLDERRTIYSDDGDVIEPFHTHRRADSRPLAPGTPGLFNIEIWPTNWVLQPGHRLRLTLTAADTPHLLPSTDSPKRIGAQTVYRDPSAPSYLSVRLAPYHG